MDESQQILQPRAEEVQRTYQWNRFEKFEEQQKDFGHNVIAHCKELEGNYKQFINYLTGFSEAAWARRVAGGHLNFLQDFAFAREHNKEFIRRDQAQVFFYRNMGDKALDTLVQFLKTEDEGKILLPKYWPEEFGDAEVLKILYVQRSNRFEREHLAKQGFPDDWIKDHLKRFPPINRDDPVFTMNSRFEELMDELGQEQVNATLLEKIPQFPPEVHHLRMEVMDEALVVLNALYTTAIAYEQKLMS